jgi:hypothetical protein
MRHKTFIDQKKAMSSLNEHVKRKRIQHLLRIQVTIVMNKGKLSEPSVLDSIIQRKIRKGLPPTK